MISTLAVALAFILPARADVNGIPLPPGAVARLGSAKFPPGSSRSFDQAAYSPDAQLVVTTVGQYPLAMIWDTRSGRLANQIETSSAKNVTPTVLSFAFAPNGRSLVSVTGSRFGSGNVRAWDLQTGQRLWATDVDTGQGWAAAVYAPDSRGFFILCAGRVELHSATDGDLIWRSERGEGFAYMLRVSPDGRFVATAGNEKEVAVFDAATGKRVGKIRGEARGFTADNRLLIKRTEGENRTVFLYAGVDGKESALTELKASETECACSGDGRTIVVHQDGDRLQPLDPVTGRRFPEWNAPQDLVDVNQPENWYRLVAVAPDGRTIATTDRAGRLRLWDVAAGREFAVRERLSGCNKLVFSPDGRTLTTSFGSSSQVLLWDLTGGAARAASAGPDNLLVTLGDCDVAAARRAVWRLAVDPDAISAIKQLLRPPTAADDDTIRELITALDGPRFTGRESAKRQLAEMGMKAGPALRTAVKNASADALRRIDPLLVRLDLLASRAVHVLELANTSEARVLLRELASGDEQSPVTHEARRVQQRCGEGKRAQR